jgi:hypothetical protein
VFVVIHSLNSDADAAGPSHPPTKIFSSPFLRMKPYEFLQALQEKKKSMVREGEQKSEGTADWQEEESREALSASDNLLIIVDAHTVEDGSILICEE